MKVYPSNFSTVQYTQWHGTTLVSNSLHFVTASFMHQENYINKSESATSTTFTKLTRSLLLLVKYWIHSNRSRTTNTPLTTLRIKYTCKSCINPWQAMHHCSFKAEIWHETNLAWFYSSMVACFYHNYLVYMYLRRRTNLLCYWLYWWHCTISIEIIIKQPSNKSHYQLVTALQQDWS